MSLPVIKLTRGVPPVESFPTARISTCAAVALDQYADAVLQYGHSLGFGPLREQIADAVAADADQVVVGQGSLQLQDFCARSLLETGDLVYVEQPSYDRALTILRRAGARLVGIPMEEDGLDVDVLARRLRAGERPRILYVIPDFQNPSGLVLSAEKRRRLVALAAQYDFWIVEDIPYRPLRYRGQAPPTLHELAPERVLLMSSYSKLICPGIRVGYVVLPRALVAPLARMAEDTYISPSLLNQAIVYEFIRRGWLGPNVAHLCALYAPRLDAALAALATHADGLASWTRPDGGFFVGITLGGQVDADRLLRQAREGGLLLTDGRGFFVDDGGAGGRFIRLPFCALTPEEIAAGVERLVSVLRPLLASA